MNDKELKILFLQKKLENETKNLSYDDFFQLIKHKIGWKQYHKINSEYVNNSLLDFETHNKLTELGRNTLNILVIEYQKEQKDKIAEHKKLHNESVISGWKRKTFWYIFALGLFGGIYSGIDLFNKITSKKEVQVEQLTRQEMEAELTKLRTLILSQKSQDSSKNPNSELNK